MLTMVLGDRVWHGRRARSSNQEQKTAMPETLVRSGAMYLGRTEYASYEVTRVRIVSQRALLAY